MKTTHEVVQSTSGKYVIKHHPALRGLEFSDRKHAEQFLFRVTRAEVELERCMREAVESVRRK